MRFGPRTCAFFCIVVLSLLQVAKAWEELDFEIFELWDSIKKKDGTTNWYELIGTKENASLDEISRAYKKLGRKYHPDKLKGTPKEIKQATEKFSRLGLVATILRDSYKRKRYNFFKKNGVPVWRGTGYLYSRWRPGVGSVIVIISLFFSLFQYLFAALSYWRAQQRIQEIEEELKSNSPQSYKSPSNTRNIRGFDSIDDEQVEYVSGGIDPYTVEPADINNLLLVKIGRFFIYKIKVLAGIQTLEDEDGNFGQVLRGEDDETNAPLLSSKYAKKNKKSNSSGHNSKDNSVATSDAEFNAMVIEKSNVEAAMSQDSQSQSTSISTNKKQTKKRRGPVV